MRFLRRLIQKEDATSAVEYAVVLALIVVVCVVSITAVGEAAYDALWDVARSMD